MKFIKKNKMVVVIIAIFVILVIIGTQAIKLLFPNNGTPVYGDRLSGIDNVKIKDEIFQNINSTLKSEGLVKKTTNSIKGKLVSITITVEDNTSLDASKQIGDKILTFFDEKQLSFYDFQIFVKKENAEIKNFPIIGYKHHNNKTLTWSKDR